MLRKYRFLFCCLALVTFPSLLSGSPDKVDGTPLFKEMGAKFTELTEEYPDHPGWEEAGHFLRRSTEEPGEEMLSLLEKMEPMFALLEQIAEADFYSRPAPDEYLLEKMIPHVHENRHFAAFIWARIYLLHQEGQTEKAEVLLWQLREAYLSNLSPGTAIEFFTYVATFRERYGKMYYIFAEGNEKENLKRQGAFLETFPSFLEWVIGDKWMQLNTVDQMYGEDTREAVKNLVDKILRTSDKETGEGRKIVRLLKDEKLFNLDLWGDSIRQTIYQFHEELGPALEGYPEEYQKWFQKQSETWSEWAGETNYQNVETFINETTEALLNDPKLTPETFIEVDEIISKALKGVYLGIIMSPYHTFYNHHLLCLAAERLLAIHLAADLYEEEYGHKPKRLSRLAETGLLPGKHLIDPFSGENFRLRLDADWQPYSIGVNRQDNQGTYIEWQDLRRGKKGDLLLFATEE